LSTRLQKWGNSLAVRIPKAFTDEMEIGENASLHMQMKDGALIMTPIRGKGWNLAALLAGVTEENRHGEWETSGRSGMEEW